MTGVSGRRSRSRIRLPRGSRRRSATTATRPTLDPSASLAPNTTYTAHLTSDTNSSTNPLSPVSWSFTTGNPPAAVGQQCRQRGDHHPRGRRSPTVLSQATSSGSASASGATPRSPPAVSEVELDNSGSTDKDRACSATSSPPPSPPRTPSPSRRRSRPPAASSPTAASIRPHRSMPTAARRTSRRPPSPRRRSRRRGRPDAGRLLRTAALTSETPPSGMTERFDQAVPSTNQYKVTAVADQLLASAGATGTRVAHSTLAASTSASSWHCVRGGAPPCRRSPPRHRWRWPAGSWW